MFLSGRGWWPGCWRRAGSCIWPRGIRSRGSWIPRLPGSWWPGDYFDAAPEVEDYPYTYTDGPALSHPRQAEFQHGLGEIVTSLAEAGLRMDFVHEHDFEAFERFESLQRQEDGMYRFPPGQPRVPMMFSLRASRPGPG
jgi:hypothetical protein